MADRQEALSRGGRSHREGGPSCYLPYPARHRAGFFIALNGGTVAQAYDIQVDQGVDTERTFNCVDGYGNAMDFSGYSARMQVRRSTYQKEPIDELTVENGRLFFEGARLTAIFPSDVTSRYPPGRSRYDIELVSNTGRVLRLLRGYFDVIPEVTR